MVTNHLQSTGPSSKLKDLAIFLHNSHDSPVFAAVCVHLVPPLAIELCTRADMWTHHLQLWYFQGFRMVSKRTYLQIFNRLKRSEKNNFFRQSKIKRWKKNSQLTRPADFIEATFPVLSETKSLLCVFQCCWLLCSKKRFPPLRLVPQPSTLIRILWISVGCSTP